MEDDMDNDNYQQNNDGFGDEDDDFDNYDNQNQ